jgi:hypothetical protein
MGLNLICIFVRTGHDLAIKLLKMQQLDDEDDELAYRYHKKQEITSIKILKILFSILYSTVGTVPYDNCLAQYRYITGAI